MNSVNVRLHSALGAGSQGPGLPRFFFWWEVGRAQQLQSDGHLLYTVDDKLIWSRNRSQIYVQTKQLGME